MVGVLFSYPENANSKSSSLPLATHKLRKYEVERRDLADEIYSSAITLQPSELFVLRLGWIYSNSFSF